MSIFVWYGLAQLQSKFWPETGLGVTNFCMFDNIIFEPTYSLIVQAFNLIIRPESNDWPKSYVRT